MLSELVEIVSLICCVLASFHCLSVWPLEISWRHLLWYWCLDFVTLVAERGPTFLLLWLPEREIKGVCTLAPNPWKSSRGRGRIGCKKKFGAWTAQRQSPRTESQARFEVWSRSNLSAELSPIDQSHASILPKTTKWQQLPEETATKNKLLIRSAVGESQLQFHKQTMDHSTLRLQLPVQIQVISSTEIDQLSWHFTYSDNSLLPSPWSLI